MRQERLRKTKALKQGVIVTVTPDVLDDRAYLGYVLKGVALTILSALFAVVGIVTAVETSLVAGLLILFSSVAFWGYTCILSDMVESRSPPSR